MDYDKKGGPKVVHIPVSQNPGIPVPQNGSFLDPLLDHLLTTKHRLRSSRLDKEGGPKVVQKWGPGMAESLNLEQLHDESPRARARARARARRQIAYLF